MRGKNEAIGRVECPHKGCAQKCDVFKFRARGESERSVANQRRAGRFYGRCPEHGMFSGESPAVNEYIAENAEIWGSKKPASAGEPPAVAEKPAPVVVPESPAKPPAQRPQPAKKPPAKAPSQTGQPMTQPNKWGFF